MNKWGFRGVVACLAMMLLMAGCSSGSSKDEASIGNAASSEKADMLDMDLNRASGGSGEMKSQTSAQAAPAAGSKELAGGNESVDKAVEAPVSSVGAGGGAGFAGGGAAAAPPDAINRKLIYKANMTMKVEDYGRAQSDIRDLVALAGGYIVQFAETESTHEQGGSFIFKIPAAGFSSFLKDMEQIPHLRLQRSMQGQDVSEEYVDLESRLNAKQVQEARYLEFMQKAVATDDLVSFTNELGKIQEEIERIKGRMRFIDQNVAFSTVELRIYQPLTANDASEEKEPANVWERAEKALKSSVNAMTTLIQALLVFAAGLLPVAAVGALVGVPVWLGYRRLKAKEELRAEEARQLRLEQNRNTAQAAAQTSHEAQPTDSTQSAQSSQSARTSLMSGEAPNGDKDSTREG